jgi:hypothetical protein
VHRRVALEVVTRIAGRQQAERLPRAEAKERVRRQGDWHVDVEDLLAEPLVDVLGRPEDRERNAAHEQSRSGNGENRGCFIQ